MTSRTQNIENLKKIVPTVVVWGLILWALFALGNWVFATFFTNHGPHGGFAVPVVIETIQKESVTDNVEFLGTTHNDNATTIRSQVAGKIVRVFVQDGARVVKGEPLFAVDSRPQAENLRSLEAILKASQAETQKARSTVQSIQAQQKAAAADLQFNQAQLTRYEKLRATQSVSQKDWEQYQSTVTQLQNKVDGLNHDIQAEQRHVQQLEAQIQRDIAASNSARATLDFYTVKAPFSGTVGDILVTEGDQIDYSTVLTRVNNDREMEITIPIPIALKNKVKHGTRLALYSTDGNFISEAKVDYIAPTLDKMTQTLTTKVRVNNTQKTPLFTTDEVLRARMILGKQTQFVAPASAINRVAGQPFIYQAVQKGTGYSAKLLPVTLGPIANGKYPITSGIQKEIQIITGGIQKLQDGVPVSAIKEEAAHK